ncbi:DUF697 domain-containing protein [Staphylococcus felis]|uniref:DUF697 domain-containing protein n=1 Tax=Staphylococcus felis TaxID=46127 RepID=A0A3E0INI3_9STAP|nr:DUF697 domain-containing protein [Staphylococcus felis]MBH9581459.1 DUF697 domain-containing protein [Staphylococcus felis]MDM8328073.1 DUF697 domain-containing protein [Staphylococcus felis]REH75333.1 DUF697 domain-containing protein [Staphylococcus felis]REH83213.1 DUF697 domain-containing protein [Staphylococcus felis]REH85459.1 DUF697 domain-containing protein [Staphylococcus felis]
MKFSNKIAQSVGNKVLNIDEITQKDQLPQTIEDLNQRRKYAENIVKKKALLSSGATLVPVPGFDFGVDVKLMRDIIEDINKIYGLDHKQVNKLSDDVKNRIYVAAGIQGSQLIGKKVTNGIVKIFIRDLAKRTAAKQTRWFPLVGQAVSASISYYFMTKLGKEHIQKCEDVAKALV